MDVLAKRFQHLVKSGFKVETFADAQVRGAHPQYGYP